MPRSKIAFLKRAKGAFTSIDAFAHSWPKHLSKAAMLRFPFVVKRRPFPKISSSKTAKPELNVSQIPFFRYRNFNAKALL
jgi:hypothetical protein